MDIGKATTWRFHGIKNHLCISVLSAATLSAVCVFCDPVVPSLAASETAPTTSPSNQSIDDIISSAHPVGAEGSLTGGFTFYFATDAAELNAVLRRICNIPRCRVAVFVRPEPGWFERKNENGSMTRVPYFWALSPAPIDSKGDNDEDSPTLSVTVDVSSVDHATLAKLEIPIKASLEEDSAISRFAAYHNWRREDLERDKEDLTKAAPSTLEESLKPRTFFAATQPTSKP